MSFVNLINGNRLPILFVGSGFSRRYIGAPDWEGLLREVFLMMNKTEQDFKAFKSRIKYDSKNKSITEGELYALIATEIENLFNSYFYDSDLIEKYPEWIDDIIPPFKNCIGMKLGTLSVLEEKREEVSILKKLRGKVASIVTTNYDTLLESIFGFHEKSIFVGQPQMFNPLSVEINELYKIHGCISQPELITITSHDYRRFRENAKLFSAKLLTLISENPVVFIGYKIGDPNIHQTLVDLVSCLTSKQIEDLKNHFYLIEYRAGQQSLEEKEYLFDATSYEGKRVAFPITVITTDNYIEIYESLNKLTPAMNINAVKQVKRIIKDIVVESTSTNNIEEPIITVLLEDIHRIEHLEKEQKMAIAIGKINNIKEYGYGLKPHIEIFEDILLDNKNIDSERILLGTYEQHYLRINQNLPIYKYVSTVPDSILDECPRVKAYLQKHNTLESYLNKQLIQYSQKAPVGSDIKNIPSEYNGTMRRRYLWIFKNINKINRDELKEFLKEELQRYESFDSNEKGFFNRLISMYDYLTYKLNNP